MKELARLRITEVDQRIRDISNDELDEKIDLIYSLGYVYNPYAKQFYNPFIEQGLKALVVYNLDCTRIINLHQSLEEEFIEKNKGIRSIKEIDDKLLKNYSISGIFLFLSSESSIFSVVCFFLTLLAHFFQAIEVAIIFSLLSFGLINSFVFFNLLYSKYELEWSLSIMWKKYKNLWTVFSLAMYPYSYYLLYLTLDNLWGPLIILFTITYVIRKYLIKNLEKRYWVSAFMEFKTFD